MVRGAAGFVSVCCFLFIEAKVATGSFDWVGGLAPGK